MLILRFLILHIHITAFALLCCGHVHAAQDQPVTTSTRTAEGPIVRTASGRVQGRWEKDGSIATFKGIPFAAPPVGPLRWMPPEPPQPWQGIRNSHEYGASCPQQSGMESMGRSMLRDLGEDPEKSPPNGITNEDCLFINVWSPDLEPEELAPVMVWIHGGGHRIGSSRFDSSQICSEGFVSVNFNMRLGVLGFFSHPSLSAASPTGASGNQSLEDDIAALRWVQQNIVNFGGDPNRVVLGGLSAGASSAALLLTAPSAQGLFHSVISVSPGPIAIHHGLITGAQNQLTSHEYGEMLAIGLGLDPDASVEELQSVPVENVLAAAFALEAAVIHVDSPFTPKIDGAVLPEPILDRIASGQTPEVPIIIGTASGEESFISDRLLFALSRGDFTDYVRRTLGPHANDALERYGSDPSMTDIEKLRPFVGDLIFTANAHVIAEAWAESGRDVWLYHNTACFPEDHPGHPMGSFHGYAFGNGGMNAIPWDPKRVFKPLDDRMMKRFHAMATSKNPNLPDQPHWPAFTLDSAPYLLLSIDSDEVLYDLRPDDLKPLQMGYRLKPE